MTMLSVVIPAYNEEDGIRAVAGRVLAMRPQLAAAGVAELELIVVDDCSRDRTAELVRAMPGVRLIRHRANGGYGAALKTGFAAARGEWIGFLDADGTYPPEHFPQLCAAAAAQGADIVIGSRILRAASRMPPVRRLGNLIFARLVSLVSARRITDSASGMRIFRRSILERIYPLPDGLNLTPVMSTRALHEGLLMVEVPIPYAERQGSSKLSVVRDGMRFAQSIVWTALTYNPGRQLGIVGLLCAAAALALAVYLVALRAGGVSELGPGGVSALFAGAVLGVAGVSIFILGSMFDYLVSLFNGRPDPVSAGRRRFPGGAIDRHFWWLGLLALLAGVTLGFTSMALGLRGWPVARLWFWGLMAAMSALVGLQLVIGWFIMRALDELSRRRERIAGDLTGAGAWEEE